MTCRLWAALCLTASAALLGAVTNAAPTSKASIRGEGATFPAPLYLAWAAAYQRATGVTVQYAAVGSGRGIEGIEAQDADFGATDVPLSATELQRAQLRQFPAIIGGVVPVVNVAGIKSGSLKLSGRVLADIYQGLIKRWDDAAIAAINPDLALPRQNITVVHRADSSGTTFLWTRYLSTSSTEWRTQIGAHPELAWRAGVGGIGNEGVASYVERTRASLGYVEYEYAKRHHLSVVSVDGRDGAFLLPTRASFELATHAATWHSSAGTYEIAAYQEPAQWPITGVSYILVPSNPHHADSTREVLHFVYWAFTHGSLIAQQLNYVSLPDAVMADIEKGWEENLKDQSGRAIWTRSSAR